MQGANKKEKNILILCMSKLNSARASFYYAKKPESSNVYYFLEGISQLEPGTKFFLNCLASEGKKLDKIIVACSPETSPKTGKERKKEESENNAGKKPSEIEIEKLFEQYDVSSVYDFYVKRISEYIKNENAETEDYAQEDEKNLVLRRENLKELYKGVNIRTKLIKSVDINNEPQNDIKIIRDAIIKNSENCENVNVYMDMQGGPRTFAAMMNGVVTLLENDKFTFKNKVSISFNRDNPVHEIIDETESYKIYDLISAMKSFINYGKADLLVRFFTDTEKINKKEHEVLQIIQEISDSIQICAPAYFDDAIENLKNEVDFTNVRNDKSIHNFYFKFVLEDIGKDYGNLLKESNTFDTIKWCYKKGFTQQALTYIEDKIPEFLFKKNIFEIEEKPETSLLDSSASFEKLKKYAGATPYETRMERMVFYDLPGKILPGDWRKIETVNICSDDVYAELKKVYEQKDENKIYRCFQNNINKTFAKEDIFIFFNRYSLQNIVNTIDNNAAEVRRWTTVEFIKSVCFLYRKEKDIISFFLALAELMNSEPEIKRMISNEKKNKDFEKKYIRNKTVIAALAGLKIEDNEDLKKKAEKLLKTGAGENGETGVAFMNEKKKAMENALNDGDENAYIEAYTDFRLKVKGDKNVPIFAECIDNPVVTCSEYKNEDNNLVFPEFKISINVKKEDKEKFRQFLRLHMALKNERNCSNHAQEGEDRIGLGYVNKAIEIYLKWGNELFGR